MQLTIKIENDAFEIFKLQKYTDHQLNFSINKGMILEFHSN